MGARACNLNAGEQGRDRQIPGTAWSTGSVRERAHFIKVRWGAIEDAIQRVSLWPQLSCTGKYDYTHTVTQTATHTR